MNTGSPSSEHLSPPLSPAAASNGEELCGFLNKERSGKWPNRKGKGWHQCWFVLDREKGILSYYKYRQSRSFGTNDYHAKKRFDVKEPGVALTISGENKRGTPSPFCFKLSIVGGKSIRMCAETDEEFKAWISALLIHINNSSNTNYPLHHEEDLEDLEEEEELEDLEDLEEENLGGYEDLEGEELDELDIELDTHEFRGTDPGFSKQVCHG